MNAIYPGNPLAQVPFMMMAFYLLVVCVVIQVTVSLLMPANEAHTRETLWWSSPLEPLRIGNWTGMTDPRLMAIALIAIMGILYFLFQ